MPRGGSFGGASLNPLGGGSFGGDSQYNIGDDLLDMQRYQAEVDWGNGKLSNEAYLQVLQSVLAAATPNSQVWISAKNKLDDVTYRIGRSNADAQGLDALIAFDQMTLGGMNPNNVRYKEVLSSLQSELSQRRSRDYGALVDTYNSGQSSTQVLVDWVRATLSGMNSRDPDYASWQGTLAELGRRQQDEKDAAAAQDYQTGDMKPRDYLAYIKGRRDSYAPQSPSWAEWDRRLEDTTKSVKDAQQAAADKAFFDAYDEGHKSNASYLLYVKRRLDGMEKDDPDYETWRHTYESAVWSIAESDLRFKVSEGQRPITALVDFYTTYAATLNHGSPEWQRVHGEIDSLKKQEAKGSGGGGGGGGGSTASGVPVPFDPKASVTTPPTLSGALISSRLPANASGYLVETRDTNTARLKDALGFGASVWLYQDPSKPGQTVQAQNGDGQLLWLDAKGKVTLTKTGKPAMTQGSGYLPASQWFLAKLQAEEGNWHAARAAVFFAGYNPETGKPVKNGYEKWQYETRQADSAFSEATRTDIKSEADNLDNRLRAIDDGITAARRAGDLEAEWNLAQAGFSIISQYQNDPAIEDAVKSKLESWDAKWDKLPELPRADPNDPTVQIGGAIDVANSTFGRDENGNRVMTKAALGQGFHQVYDLQTKTITTENEVTADWYPGKWQRDHITVATEVGGRIVVADTKVVNAGSADLLVHTSVDGLPNTKPLGAIAGVALKSATYFDGSGNLVTLYSLDGQNWVKPPSGVMPQLEIGTDLTARKDDKGVTVAWQAKDDTGALVDVFTVNTDDTLTVNTDALDMSTAPIKWYGQGQVDSYLVQANAVGAARNYQPSGLGSTGNASAVDVDAIANHAATIEFGAPGQHMGYSTVSSDGVLNQLPAPYEAVRTGEHSGGYYEAPEGTFSGSSFVQPTLQRQAWDVFTGVVANLAALLPNGTPARYPGSGLVPVQPYIAMPPKPGPYAGAAPRPGPSQVYLPPKAIVQTTPAVVEKHYAPSGLGSTGKVTPPAPPKPKTKIENTAAKNYAPSGLGSTGQASPTKTPRSEYKPAATKQTRAF